MEAALGANLQTIVMKDTMIAESVHQDADRAEARQGRARAARARPRISSTQSEPLTLPEGAIDWLINKITAAAGGAAARRAARSITPCSCPISRRRCASSRRRGSAVVTLAGEVLTGDGILHGGATGEAVNSVLQRKNQIARARSRGGAGSRQQIDGVTAAAR